MQTRQSPLTRTEARELVIAYQKAQKERMRLFWVDPPKPPTSPMADKCRCGLVRLLHHPDGAAPNGCRDFEPQVVVPAHRRGVA